MIVVAASGSVGEMIAPSANAAAHGRPPTSACAAHATAPMVSNTSPIVLSGSLRTLARRSPKFAKIEAP
jgi:hypothetical protein